MPTSDTLVYAELAANGPYPTIGRKASHKKLPTPAARRAPCQAMEAERMRSAPIPSHIADRRTEWQYAKEMNRLATSWRKQCGSESSREASEHGGSDRLRTYGKLLQFQAMWLEPVIGIARAKATAMIITTLSSREFNQDTSRAKKAARQGPVFITDRGTPPHVLLSIEDYRRLTSGLGSIIDALGLPPGIEDVELEIPPMRDLARYPERGRVQANRSAAPQSVERPA